MTEAQGERHDASPEHGLVQGNLNLEEVLMAYDYSDHAEEEDDGVSLSEFLEDVWQLFREGRFISGYMYDYRNLQKLDFGKSIGSDFWQDNKATIEQLADGLYREYFDEVAGTAAYFTEFFIEHPDLIRLHTPAGPFVTGVDAEFDMTSTSRKYDNVVMAYTSDDEPEYPDRRTKLYVNISALPKNGQEIVRKYCADLEIEPDVVE